MVEIHEKVLKTEALPNIMESGNEPWSYQGLEYLLIPEKSHPINALGIFFKKEL